MMLFSCHASPRNLALAAWRYNPRFLPHLRAAIFFIPPPQHHFPKIYKKTPSVDSLSALQYIDSVYVCNAHCEYGRD
jgi:hypothetical protein